MANTTLNLRVNAQFDELAQLNAEAQRSRDKIAAMEQAAKILGKTVDNTDAAVEAHIKSLKTLQRNLDQNSAEYKQAQNELDRYGSGVKKAERDNNSFSDSLKGMAGAIVAAFSIDAIGNFIGGLRDQALEARQSAAALGTTVEEVSKYQQLLRGTGVDMGKFTDLVVDMNEMLGQIASGDFDEEVNKFDKGLVALGISSRDANGQIKSATQTFNEAAIQLSKMPDGVDKSRIAINLFKASNADAIPFVNRVGKELQSTAAIMNNEFVDEVIQADQQLGKIGFQLQSMAVKILPSLIDALKPVGRAVRDALEEFNKMPDWQKQGVAIAGFAAVIGLTVIPAIASLAQAVIALNTAIVASPAAMAALGLKAGVVGAAVGATMILADAYSKASKVGEQIPVIRDKDGKPVDFSKPSGQLKLTPEQEQQLRQELSAARMTGSQQPALQKRLVDLQNELVKLQGDQKDIAITDIAKQVELREKIKQKQLEIDEVTGAAQERRDREAEQAAKKREQEAQQLAKSQAQYERDIFNLREGYERDVAKLRLDALKQVEQLELKLLEKKKTAEQQLADAILGRKRSEEDLQLEMDRAAGKLTDKQYEDQKQALEFERKLEDIRFGGLKRQSEIQAQLQADMMEAAAIPVRFAEEEARIRLKSVEDQQRAAQRLGDIGMIPSGDNTPGYSYTGARNLGGRALSYGQVIQLAMQAGFNKKDATIMAAIAMAESSLRPMAMNPDVTTGDESYGLWQINMLGAMGPERRRQFGLQRNEDLYDPMTNARAAFGLFSGRGNFADWPTFTEGIYKQFMPEALRAAQQIGGANTTTGLPVSLAPKGESQLKSIFALASNRTQFPQFKPSALTPGQFDYSNAQFGQVTRNPFALTYPNFSSFMRPSVFGQDNIDVSGLQNIATQTAQIQTEANLQTQAKEYNAALRDRFELTARTLSQARNIQKELVSQVAETRRLEELQRSMSPAAAQNVLNAEKQRDAAKESVAELERVINSQISSNNLSGDLATKAKDNLQRLKDEVVELEKMPGLIGKIVQAEEQRKLQQEQIQELSKGIANTLGQGLQESLNLLITGSENWGLALENIVVRMLNQIIDQLLYITVIQPFVKGAGDFLSNIFGNLFGGGGGGVSVGLGEGIAGIAGLAFADGGIMTQGGPMPLQRYARGGIANSPQLAMFGEGSRPEAYVPLPDGRSIPVTIKGFANGGIMSQDLGTPLTGSSGIRQILESRGFTFQPPPKPVLISPFNQMIRSHMGLAPLPPITAPPVNPFKEMIRSRIGLTPQVQGYASGGIARSPQLALFGEGSLPEAYVPLPDGRSIPVTMRGSINNSDNKTTINNINVTVSTDSSQTQGSDSRSRRLGEDLALKIQQEIIRQQRPGGLLA